MKIEICESLLQSYLKYVQRCRLTQTNWKMSFIDQQMDIIKKESIEFAFEENKEIFYSDNVTSSQFFKQAEIDVVGYDFDTNKLFLFDTTFHENGTGYSRNGKRMNVSTIVKKCFRSTLLGLYFFGNIKKLTVAFATPKINAKDESQIKLELAEMQNKIRGLVEEVDVEISLISNKEFEDQILTPTIFASKKVADTSDLFIRSMKLSALFSSKKIWKSDIINEDNDNDAAEDSNEIQEERSVLDFYPSLDEFINQVPFSEQYFVIGFDKKCKEGIFIPYRNLEKNNKSSWRSIILSKDKLRRKNRGSIVKFVAFAKPELKAEILKKYSILNIL